jgi:hypothetical protein
MYIIQDVVTEPREAAASGAAAVPAPSSRFIGDLSMMAGYERVGFVEPGKAM